MKERILTGWTFTRTLYVLMGVALIGQSYVEHQWFGLAFGGYFAAMGVFNFGCAAGGCYGNACAPSAKLKSDKGISEIEFEEVKNQQ